MGIYIIMHPMPEHLTGCTNCVPTGDTGNYHLSSNKTFCLDNVFEIRLYLIDCINEYCDPCTTKRTSYKEEEIREKGYYFAGWIKYVIMSGEQH
jgi:hypothetical protein